MDYFRKVVLYVLVVTSASVWLYGLLLLADGLK